MKYSWIALLLLSSIYTQVNSAELTTQNLSDLVSRGSLRSVILPKEDIRLSSQTEGIVASYPTQEGQKVTQESVLIELDADMERIEVAQAKTILEQTREEYERVLDLFNENISSQKQLTEAKSRYEQAQHSLELAEVRLSYRFIKSPINGIFFKKTKNVGEAVGRFETVARVIDTSTLEMLLYLGPQWLGKFVPKDTVQVELLEGPHKGTIVQAKVSQVDTLLDPANGTFRLKLELEPSEAVQAGISAMLITPKN